MSKTRTYERVRTCNSVWYLSLPWMEKFLKKIPTRDYFQKLIREYCESLGITRRSMGLVTGARASMYFDGNWTSVSFDAIEVLAKNGTDILFIEKADIAEVFTEFSKKYGVALVNTIGYLTEYGKDLMKEAERSGAHIAILTDYEDYGLNMVANIAKHVNIPRIGVDEETLQYFGLDRERLSVSSKGKIKDFSYLHQFEHIDKEFLKSKRVEIDAVLVEVGTERLWEYIMHKLIELFPKRNYNRAISMPPVERLYPKPIQDFLTYINTLASEIINDDVTKIQKSLLQVEGMINVDERNLEIYHQLNKAVEEDDAMKDIVSKIIELLPRRRGAVYD